MKLILSKSTQLLVTLHLVTNLNGYSQKKLILTRIGTKNNIYYKVGDDLRLKTQGTDYYVGGEILALDDSKIQFELFDIHIDSIKEIDIRGKHMNAFNVGQYGPQLILAGVGYFILASVNQENINTKTTYQSAGIIGFGYILWLLREKKFKVKGRNKITIID